MFKIDAKNMIKEEEKKERKWTSKEEDQPWVFLLD